MELPLFHKSQCQLTCSAPPTLKASSMLCFWLVDEGFFKIETFSPAERGCCVSEFGWIGALGASFTWVIGSACYTSLSRNFHPQQINFMRALSAFPLFLLAAILSGQWRVAWELPTDQLLSSSSWLCLSILASYGLGDAFFFKAGRILGFPAAQAISAVYPVWAVLFGYLFLGQSMGLWAILGLAMTLGATIWVILIARHSHQQLPDSPSLVMGVVAALVTSVAWAVNGVAAGRGGAVLPSFAGNVIRVGFALGLIAVILKSQGQKLCLPWSTYRKWWPVFCIEAFGGSALFLYGLGNTSVAVGTTLSSLAPVLAIPWAVAAGWEKFSFQKSLAVLLVVCGVTLLVVFG